MTLNKNVTYDNVGKWVWGYCDYCGGPRGKVEVVKTDDGALKARCSRCKLTHA